MQGLKGKDSDMRYFLASLSLSVATVLLNPAANAQFQLQRLYSTPSASQSAGVIVQGSDGNFYGTLVSAPRIPASSGSIFKMTPSGTVTTLGTITGLNPELALGDDGDLYGTVNTQPFGGNTNGYIFNVRTNGQIATVFSFDGTNGARPISMRKGIDGCFYGVMGVTNIRDFGLPTATNRATIFQFTTNNTVTKLYSLTNVASGPELTGIPVQGPDGNLYGTIVAGTIPQFPPYISQLRVSIYRLSTNGNFQTIYTRSNAPAPAEDLIFGQDGALYGALGATRQFSVTVNDGSIFRVDTNGAYSTLFSFNSTNGSDPRARLLLANDGYLYGSTFAGGISNVGTLFRISNQGHFASLLDFTGDNGGNPSAPLIQANDGNFYGTTEGSKVAGIGTIFRLVQPTAISQFGMSNGTATLTWNSFPNGIYRVEYKSALSDLSWVPLIQRVTGTDQTITILDTQATDPQRVYRVVLLP
jgi:uncharacterized repeat protein (TIGR03803 family)